MRKSLLLSLITLVSLLVVQSCSKEYSEETGSGGTPATGYLIKDSTSGMCLPPEIHGIYDTAKVLTDSNYILINLTVTKPGFYRVYTDEQNGFSFKDSGYFSVIGTKSIKLKATGTPILPIATDFVVNFDSTVCGFTIVVTENDGENNVDPNTSDSAWVFSDGSKTYAGTISSAFFFDDSTTVPEPTHYFKFSGYIPSGTDSTIDLTLKLPYAEAIPSGTYSTSTSAAIYFSLVNIDTAHIIYEASNNTPAQVTQITVSSYNSTTRIVEGTFSGNAKTASGGTIAITNGRFKVKAER